MSELSDPVDRFSETLNISIYQEKSSNSGSLKPFSPSCETPECSSLCSEPTPKDNASSRSGYFGTLEPVSPLLPHFSHEFISPIRESDSKNQAFSFSLRQDNWTCQTFGAMSSALEGLMEPSATEAPSSCSSGFSQETSLFRSLSHQSDSLESDGATAPAPDLYIFESETQDFILNLSVDQKENKQTEYQPVSQTADLDGAWQHYSENAVTQIHHSSSHKRAMLDCESEVSQHKRLIAPAADACEASTMSVNDAQQGKAEVTDIIPQVQRSNSPIEMWLDACQHQAVEDTDNKDVLDKTGQFVMQGLLTVTGDLCVSCGNSQVSGYNSDGSGGIGWTDDDTLGWGQPVERWSSVDSWASALSDWTDRITTALPEDLTAAFTEIGAEIDALRQALAEVNTHIDTETSRDRTGQEPAEPAQSQQPMGVQDQSLKTKNLPDGSILSEQSCLSLCLEASGHELQEVSLCDVTLSTPGVKEPDGITPCPKHLHTMVVSPDPTVASTGRYGVDAFPESSYSTDGDLSHFGGYLKSLKTGFSISTDEDRVVLNITEDTDLEEQKQPAELLTEDVR